MHTAQCLNVSADKQADESISLWATATTLVSSGYCAHRLFEHLPSAHHLFTRDNLAKCTHLNNKLALYNIRYKLYTTASACTALCLLFLHQSRLAAVSEKVKSTLEGLQRGVKIVFWSKSALPITPSPSSPFSGLLLGWASQQYQW